MKIEKQDVLLGVMVFSIVLLHIFYVFTECI